jgi:HD-like signal output (HDOD) protein
MQNIILGSVLECARDLPPISKTAIELINVIDNPDTNRSDIIKLVSLDEVIFANAFKYANSAAMGARREIRNTKEIIDLLGLQELKKLAITIAARNAISDGEIWYSSIFMASCSQKLARKLNFRVEDVDDVYTAALMMSYGALVFRIYYSEEYTAIEEETNLQERIRLEEENFGINHIELAYQVLEEWGLPKKALELIRNQQYIDRFTRANALIELSRIMSRLEFATDSEIEQEFLKDSVQNLVKEFDFEVFDLSPSFVRKMHDYALEFVSL